MKINNFHLKLNVSLSQIAAPSILLHWFLHKKFPGLQRATPRNTEYARISIRNVQSPTAHLRASLEQNS